MEKNKGLFGGISFFGVLTIIFVVLKLVGVVNWSWLWVLAPLWLPTILGFAGWLIFGVILGKAVTK